MRTENIQPYVNNIIQYNNSISEKSAVKDPIHQQKMQQETQQLKITEQKVIAHEAAHKSAGGRYTGAVNYEYKIGPDGKRYIAGGEVSIDMSDGKDTEETIKKMQQVIRAALAPPDPSSKDHAVAAKAKMQMAQQELNKEDTEDNTNPEGISIYI